MPEVELDHMFFSRHEQEQRRHQIRGLEFSGKQRRYQIRGLEFSGVVGHEENAANRETTMRILSETFMSVAMTTTERLGPRMPSRRDSRTFVVGCCE